MEMSVIAKNKKRLVQSAFYFNIGMICMGCIMSTAILFLEQLQTIASNNTIRIFIFSGFTLCGAITALSIANFIAKAYKKKIQ